MPSTPQVAFFDLDRTLIDGYSLTAFAAERLSTGLLSWRDARAQLGAIARYTLGRGGYNELMKTCLAQLAGERAADFAAFSEQVFRNRLRQRIYPEARALVRRYRGSGVHVVMVTSASRYQATPIARSLGIREIWCTELEVAGGLLTGAAEPCFGAGKLTAAQRVCGRLGVKLEQCVFYSDSDEDLPLLEAVGQPVAVNPNAELARIARSSAWQVLRFAATRKQRPRPLQWLSAGWSSLQTLLPVRGFRRNSAP